MKKLILLASFCLGMLFIPLGSAEAAPFLATFRTTGPNESITLPLPQRDGTSGADIIYNFTVDWGDTLSDVITAYDQAEIVHTYADPGDHQISITGSMPMWKFDSGPSATQILSLDDAGDVGFGVGMTSFKDMFEGCSNLTSVALFDTSTGTTFAGMFSGASAITTIPNFDTSNGTTFLGMFNEATSLESIPNLNTSSGGTFANMFFNASSLTSIPFLDASSAVGTPTYAIRGTALTAGGFSGLKYSIDYRYTNMGADALRDVFNALGTADNTYSQQTINIEGLPGHAELTSSDYAIAEAKGWEVVPAIAETCDDGTMNGDETGIDCGGSTCNACQPFLATFRTSIDGESITLPLPQREGTSGLTMTYDFMVDWGDGTTPDHITTYNQAERVHSYSTAGDYQISITGSMPYWNFGDSIGNSTSRNQIISLDDAGNVGFGSVGRESFMGMFYRCENLTSVALFDTSAGTHFGSMFRNTPSLTSIPQFDTSSGTNFTMMFQNSGIETIPTLDTSAGLDFSLMFAHANNLTSVPALNTSLGTNFSSMFYSCDSLNSVSLLDTSNGENFTSMFYECGALNEIPFLNVSSGTNFGTMFGYTPVLAQGALNGTRYSIQYLNNNLDADALRAIFEGLGNADNSTEQQTIHITGNPGHPSLTEADYAIAEAKGWVIIPDIAETCEDGIVNQGETGLDCGGPNCAACQPFLATFRTTTTNESINLPLLYAQAGSLGTIKFTHNFIIDWGDGTSNSFVAVWNDVTNSWDQTGEKEHVYAAPGDHQVSITGTMEMWKVDSFNALKLISIDDAGDVGFGSKTENFSSMFHGAENLTTVSLFDTSKGTDFQGMFQYTGINTIPLFDTSSGTNFNEMFRSTPSLTTIPVIDTSSGTDFNGMFSFSPSLSSVPLIDTSAGTDFGNMFHRATTLTTIAPLNTSSGTSFVNMFSGTNALIQGALNGTHYSISYADANMNAAALRDVFVGLGIADNSVSQQTINITGNPGQPELTAADYGIAEDKGWLIVPDQLEPVLFPSSGIDFDQSQMSISATSNQHATMGCLGETLPHTFTLTELGFDETISSIADFGDFSVNPCFQMAGDYTIQVNLFDKAGNFSSVPAITLTVTSADPNEGNSTLTASCPNTVANGEDVCDLTLSLKDQFGNEIEQEIDSLNLFSTTVTDSDDANEGISFRNGLKIGASNFTSASKIPFSWDRLSPSSWNVTSLAPSIEKINIGDFPGNHLSTVVDKLLSFSIDNLPTIEEDGSIGARSISFDSIPAFLRFGSPIEVEPMFSPPQFAFGEEIEVHSVLNYPTIVNGLSTLINTNLKSISEHEFADPNATTTDEEGNPVVVLEPINIDHTFTNIVDLETNAIPRIVYAASAYDTPGDVALVTRASYSIGGTPVEFVAGGIGDPLLESIEAVGAVPADVLGFNDEDLGMTMTGVSIEGLVLGDEDQMYLVEGDDNKIASLGAVNKKDVREEISQNSYKLVRNASNVIKDVDDFNWNLFTDDQEVVVVDLSEEALAEATLSLSGQLPSGQKTLIVLNGNVAFTGDVTYGDTANDSFGLVLIRDKAGKNPERGNIFVRGNVQQLSGSMFADGSFFANDTNNLEDVNSGNRDNQLVLTGSLLARNTIGGSRRISGEGQFFTPWETSTDAEFTKRFDLHEVRKYYEGGSGSCTNAGAGCDVNKASFVIRVDQKSTLLPPPGFRN